MIPEYLNEILYIIRKKSRILQKGGLKAKVIFDGLHYSISAVTQMVANLNNPNPATAHYQKALIGGGWLELEAITKKLVTTVKNLKDVLSLKDLENLRINTIAMIAYLEEISTKTNSEEVEKVQQDIGDLVEEIVNLTFGNGATPKPTKVS